MSRTLYSLLLKPLASTAYNIRGRKSHTLFQVSSVKAKGRVLRKFVVCLDQIRNQNLEERGFHFSMAPVLSRSLATASLASLPSASSFLLRNSNSNSNRVLNLTTAFVPQNGLRKRFSSSSGLKWKYERRNHRFALRCEAAAVAEKEAADDTSGEKFEYQAEVRIFSIFPFQFLIPSLLVSIIGISKFQKQSLLFLLLQLYPITSTY